MSFACSGLTSLHKVMTLKVVLEYGHKVKFISAFLQQLLDGI